MKSPLRGLVLLYLLGYFGCSHGGEQLAVVRTDVVIANSKTIFNAQAIASDSQDLLYVLDSSDRNIKAFNEKGDLLRTIGKKGQGPGEMTLPISLEISTSNELIVYDRGNYRILWYSPNGNVVKELSTARLPRLSSLSSLGDGLFVGEVSRYEGQSRISELFILDESMDKKTLIARLENKVEEGRVELFPHMFRYTAISKREVIWGDWYNNYLTVSSIDGQIERKIVFNYEQMEVTDSDKERAIKRRFGDQQPQEMLIFPKFFPYYSLFIRDANYIYLLSFERGKPSGHYYYRVNLQNAQMSKILFNPEPIEIRNDKYFALSEDEQGNQLIRKICFTLRNAK